MLRPRIAAIATFLTAAAFGQTPQAPTGTVTGHVIYADTQLPARLAHVVLQPIQDLHSAALKQGAGYHPEGLFHLKTVGLDGTFTIPEVPEGLYYVIVEQDGYVSPLEIFTRAELNAPNNAMMRKIARYMTPISVAANHTTQVEMSLIRGAEISGTVRFEDGSPAENASMKLLKRNEKGEWVSVRTNRLAGRNNGVTNDEGSYRFTGLPTGEYLVSASIELNNVMLDHIFASGGATAYGDGYSLRIFPGDFFRTHDAKPIKLEEGDKATGIDIDVPVSKLYSVRGVVQKPNSAAPVSAAHLVLRFADDGSEVASTDASYDDGSFRFDFVPSGSYILEATKIGEVERIALPPCKDCMLPLDFRTKVVTSFGDTSQPVIVTGDLSSIVLHATAAKQP
jgi:hypothetical protein